MPSLNSSSFPTRSSLSFSEGISTHLVTWFRDHQAFLTSPAPTNLLWIWVTIPWCPGIVYFSFPTVLPSFMLHLFHLNFEREAFLSLLPPSSIYTSLSSQSGIPIISLPWSKPFHVSPLPWKWTLSVWHQRPCMAWALAASAPFTLSIR